MTDPADAMSAFEQWYEQGMMRLFNYLSYRVRDKALAEDLTAAVCEKAVQNLHRYSPYQGDMGGWIFGIARHELQHHFRTDRRRPPNLSLESLPDMQARGETVEEQVDRLALTRAVMRYLGTLSERDQDIIALRYGANLSSEETARLLGLSSENVRVLLHRVLQKLRNSLISEAEVEN